MPINTIKKIIEGLLNLVIWLLSTYFIVRIFSLETQAVEEYSMGGLKSITKVYNYQMQWALLATIGFKVAFFYANIYYVTVFLFKKKYIRFLLLTFGTLALFLLIERIILLLECEQLCFADYLNLGLGLYAFFFIVSLLYASVIQWRKDLKVKRELIKEKAVAELRLLRSQINPHFLFNSLNNMLSMAEKEQQTEVAEGIARLSELLRFLIYDTASDRVKLTKEIEFINNYIGLNRLRFSEKDDIDISLKISGNPENISIAPAILITFIENAFKHGIDIYSHSFVNIVMAIEESRLIFTVVNSIHDNLERDIFNSIPHGIGLDNVRKRLAILYPEKHNLKFSKSKKQYMVELIIFL